MEAEPEIQKPDNVNVKDRSISDEMSQSYLDYAMSVIVSRALPDVRDGLKPVHRRILYAMNEMGLGAKAKHTKSAKIVGEVLGKYHPHGDTAVYDALAIMAQDFSKRYMLINGQGNFGSMDGDRPAAMRYTEAKMHALAEEILADIEKNTVEFVDNYDSTHKEPRYLPAKVPNLLLNGALGIAVGMATNIPPHNLGELVDGTKALIKNPDLDLEELMKHIPGPDFPIGATIYNKQDIATAYATGRGRVLMRADAKIEERDRGGSHIIVSSLPYQVNKADLVMKIAQLVKNKKIEGISDLRDESDRNDKVRIVVELKNNAYPKKVLNRLYSLTQMQSIFHVNMIALQDGIQPRVYNLKDILLAFIDHRTDVVRRRTQFELEKAENRAHILEGLKKALDFIDEVISTIRASKTRDAAKVALVEKFELSELQADAILEMRLAALAGLERQKVLDELKEKIALIKSLKEILGSEEKIKGIISDELDEMKERFGDERRTKIVARAVGDFTAEDLIPNEQMVITLTNANYIKRVPIDTFKSQKRGGKGVAGITTKEQDAVHTLRVANNHDTILFFTSRGRVFKSKVFELPEGSRQAKGIPIVNLIQLGPAEQVTAIITLASKGEERKYFIMGTKLGVIKKTMIDAYNNIRTSGIIAMKLGAGDELNWVHVSSGENEVMIVTKKGQSIHFKEQDTRPMGRSAGGVRGIKLKSEDEVVTMDVVRDSSADLLVVTANGFGKRTKVNLFTMQKRGGSGLRAAQVTAKTGEVVAAKIVMGNEGEIVMVAEKGQTIRLDLKSVKRLGRSTQGVTIMRFREKGDKVASMTVFEAGSEDAPVPEVVA